MVRLLSRLLAALAVPMIVAGFSASPANAARPVTVWFGLSADAAPVDGQPILAVPPQLGVAAPGVDSGALCRVSITPRSGRPDGFALLDGAVRQGCIRSYLLSPTPAAGAGTSHVVTAINDLRGRWQLLENGAPPDYYRESGVEGFRAADGDRVILRLAVAKTGVPACCL